MSYRWWTFFSRGAWSPTLAYGIEQDIDCSWSPRYRWSYDHDYFVLCRLRNINIYKLNFNNSKILCYRQIRTRVVCMKRWLWYFSSNFCLYQSSIQHPFSAFLPGTSLGLSQYRILLIHKLYYSNPRCGFLWVFYSNNSPIGSNNARCSAEHIHSQAKPYLRAESYDLFLRVIVEVRLR